MTESVALDERRAVLAAPEISEGRNVAVIAAAAQLHQSATVKEIVELVAGLGHVAEGVNARGGRQRGAAQLLNYLSGFTGATWQQRWEASRLESAGPAGFREAVCDAAGRMPNSSTGTTSPVARSAAC